MMAKQGYSVGNKMETLGRSYPIELHLNRNMYVSGGRLSGVLLLHLKKPAKILALTLTFEGWELLAKRPFIWGGKKSHRFFEQEHVLIGIGHQMRSSERMSFTWNKTLGRIPGRALSAGDHLYPFSLHLPNSMPSSYKGKSGRISYVLSAVMENTSGKSERIKIEVPVVFVPSSIKGKPVVLSYPASNNTMQSNGISINLRLPQRIVQAGKAVSGHLQIKNPKRVKVHEVTVSLERVEWLRASVDKELQGERADSITFKPDNPASGKIESDFLLKIPADAPPTVEGTTIAAAWLIRIELKTNQPLDFKTPITVYVPPQDNMKD